MSSSLTDELACSPATLADADDIAGLLRILEGSLGYRAAASATEVRFWLSLNDLDTCSWLIRGRGELIAAAWLDVHGDAAWITSVVSPFAQGRSLEAHLLHLAEPRARELGVARLRVVIYAADHAGQELLRARGYVPRRRFVTMAIELEEPPAEAHAPERVKLGAFRDEDARAFHAALSEAFVDDWSFVAMPFEEWRRLRMAQDDTSLYFLARSGSELAGAIRCEPEHRGMGWVGALGVRPVWRGQGIGRALLLRAFRAFYERGQHRVGLEVDTANPTGAVRLYEDVGMEVELETVLYERPVV